MHLPNLLKSIGIALAAVPPLHKRTHTSHQCTCLNSMWLWIGWHQICMPHSLPRLTWSFIKSNTNCWSKDNDVWLFWKAEDTKVKMAIKVKNLVSQCNTLLLNHCFERIPHKSKKDCDYLPPVSDYMHFWVANSPKHILIVCDLTWSPTHACQP